MILKKIVTTPAYYVNGEPHLGHIYSNWLAIEFSHKKNLSVLNGNDLHGRKMREFIENLSNNRGEKFLQNQVRKYSLIFKRTFINQLSYGNYIYQNTESRIHKNFVKNIWIKLLKKSLIYKKQYEGYYLLNEEKFVKEKVKNSEWFSSEEYFLNLLPFKEKVLQQINDGIINIQPKFFINKVKEFIYNIDELCISRKEVWGIPVPKSTIDNRTIHVWLDALNFYLSPIKLDLDTDEVELTHIIGKDILLFHSWYWPAYLNAIGLKFKLNLIVTGWLLSKDEKISKSLKNFKKYDIEKRYKQEFFNKFFSNRKIGYDINVSNHEFEKYINKVNDDRNLCHRILKLSILNQIFELPKVISSKTVSISFLNKKINHLEIWKSSKKLKIYFIAWTCHFIEKSKFLKDFKIIIMNSNKKYYISSILYLSRILSKLTF